MRRKRHRLLLFGGAAWLCFQAFCWPTDPLRGTWQAENELVFYDHLERVSFGSGSSGRATWGWDQNVHFDSRFTFERDGDELTVEYTDRPVRGVRRILTFAVERKRHRFERDTPVGREATVCRKKATFNATPFPPETAKSTVFYSDCSKE